MHAKIISNILIVIIIVIFVFNVVKINSELCLLCKQDVYDGDISQSIRNITNVKELNSRCFKTS